MTFNSCLIFKEDRHLKNTTKGWREAAIAFKAYADSSFSGLFLTLRDNGKFEFETSGLKRSFEAGDWKRIDNFIYLSYFDNEQKIIKTQIFVVDRSTSTIRSMERDFAL